MEDKITQSQAATFENLVKVMQAVTGLYDMPAEIHLCENFIALMKIKYITNWYCFYVNAEGVLFHFNMEKNSLIIT